MNDSEKQLKIEEIFNNLKGYIAKIKTDALTSGKKNEASSLVSYIGMILDELSNSFKKNKPLTVGKISEGLDDKIKKLLNDLDSFKSEKIAAEKLDALASYCNDVFMELMAGDSCAIPENYRN